jgi:hypothetical protein
MSPISAVQSSPKHLEVFVLEDRTIKHMTLNIEKSVLVPGKWQSDGKLFADPPLVFSRRRGRVDIMAVTPYGKVVYQEIQAGMIMNNGWEVIGDTTGPISGASMASNALDVFGRGKNGQVLHKALIDGKWTPSEGMWEDLGGNFIQPIEVVSDNSGYMSLYGVMERGGLIHCKYWDGDAWLPAQTEWFQLSTGMSLSIPACPNITSAVGADPTTRQLVGITPDRDMYYIDVTRGNSEKFAYLGKPMENYIWISRPSVVSLWGFLYVYCLGNNHTLYAKVLKNGEGWDVQGSKESLQWYGWNQSFVCAPKAILVQGRIYMFCKGYDEEIWYKSLNTQQDWISLGIAE